MTQSKRKQEKTPLTQKKSEYASDILLQQAFDYAFQPKIISVIRDGKIIRANRAACKLLGYSKTEIFTRSTKDIFKISGIDYRRPFHELKVTGSNKTDLFITGKNGKPVFGEISSVMIKDPEGISHMITTILATGDKLLKEKANAGISRSAVIQLENNDWINSIVEISYDLICDWDLATNLISFGVHYEEIFGRKLPKNKISFDEWIELFLPEDRIMIERKLNLILQSESLNWEYTFKFICPNGSVSQVISRANIIRDSSGKAIRMIGIIHDMSKQQKLQVELEREVMIREKQIVEAIVEAKEMERSDLGKELHDNVNQLLGASMLYLDMARKDIKHGESYLIHSSQYTLAAIEEIRNLTKGLASNTIPEFGLSGAIKQMIGDTMEVHSLKIVFTLAEALEDLMSDKFKLNILRIFQEQLNNILKHSKASHASVIFVKTNSELIFSITDDGIGFDTTQKAKGIGIGNIISRTHLYKGVASFISQPGHGCKLRISFPLLSVY